MGSRARGECRRRRGGGRGDRRGRWSDFKSATTGESCLRVLLERVLAATRRRSWRQERQMERRRQRAVCGVASGTRPVHPSAVGRSLAAQDGGMAPITCFFLQHHENRPRVKNQKPLSIRMRLSTLIARGLIFCRRRIWSKSPPARQAARPASAPSHSFGVPWPPLKSAAVEMLAGAPLPLVRCPLRSYTVQKEAAAKKKKKKESAALPSEKETGGGRSKWRDDRGSGFSTEETDERAQGSHGRAEFRISSKV